MRCAFLEPSQRDGARIEVASTDRTQQRHTRHAMGADFVIDFLTAQIGLDAQSGLFEKIGDFARIGVELIGDRG